MAKRKQKETEVEATQADKPTSTGSPPKSGGKKNEKATKSSAPKGRAKRDEKPAKSSTPKMVTWPKEYADFSTHATETAVAKSLTLGKAKTKLRKALRLLVSVVAPTDIDDEFGDGAQNAYKVIKSLTSGARFYTENTLYAYRMNYRYLVVLLARAFGLSQAIKTKLEVSNAPNIAAYQILRGTNPENYNTAMQKITEYDHTLLEMVSELNSLPMPSIGGLEDFFSMFSHIYKDDRGMASDYIVMVPSNIGEAQYNDDTKVISGVTLSYIQAQNIGELAATFNEIVSRMRGSVDINNLMADILNTLPSSRFDWMTVINKHAQFVLDVDPKFMTQVASATMPLASAVAIGNVSSDGSRILFTRGNIGARPDGFIFSSDDEVGQFVTTFKAGSEVECYKYMLHNTKATSSFTPSDTDVVSTTGTFIAVVDELLDLGSPMAAPGVNSVLGYFKNTASTTQSVAEEGGKRLALLYTNVKALPKLNMSSYGEAESDDDLLWTSENVKRCAVSDIHNNIKAINLMAYSTVHLTTEKAR